MHPDMWRRMVERAEGYMARGGRGAELPEAMRRKARGLPARRRESPPRKKYVRLSAYSRLRIRRGDKPDAGNGPAPWWAILKVLGGRASRCKVWRWRRRAYMAVLVAVGQAQEVERMRPADVLALELPKEAWAWVAWWLLFRVQVLGRHQAAVLPWLECRPWFGPGGEHLRASVAFELMERGWLPWRAGQVARAGVPSGPWSRQETRTDRGPRCWPPAAQPMRFGKWFRRRLWRWSWLSDIVPPIPRAAGR